MSWPLLPKPTVLPIYPHTHLPLFVAKGVHTCTEIRRVANMSR